MWGVFCKKNGKWGVFRVKKWTFPQRRVHYVQYQYFFIVHFTYLGGCVRTQRAPLPTGGGARWVPPDLTINHDDQARRYVGKVGWTIGLWSQAGSGI